MNVGCSSPVDDGFLLARSGLGLLDGVWCCIKKCMNLFLCAQEGGWYRSGHEHRSSVERRRGDQHNSLGLVFVHDFVHVCRV